MSKVLVDGAYGHLSSASNGLGKGRRLILHWQWAEVEVTTKEEVEALATELYALAAAVKGFNKEEAESW